MKSKAYAPNKMRENNRPTKTTEPNPDPTKRGKRSLPQFLRLFAAPLLKIAAEFNKRTAAENKTKREEFSDRAHLAQMVGNKRRAEYWRQRANATKT